jgi:hypothetical protein
MGDMVIQPEAGPRPVYIDDTANSTSAISFIADKTRNSGISVHPKRISSNNPGNYKGDSKFEKGRHSR